MALHRTKGEIPDDAVRLSEEEARIHQMNLLREWTPAKDVWPFRFGVGFLGVGSALSSIFINSYYRNKLHLYNYGKLSSYLPTVCLPTIMSALYHTQLVSSDIVVQKTVCPLCLEIRAASIQAFLSTVYPSLLAPIAGFMLATRYGTYNLPPIRKPVQIFKVWRNLTRPLGNTLFLISICQAFLAMGITYCEQESYINVQRQLLEEEEEAQLQLCDLNKL